MAACDGCNDCSLYRVSYGMYGGRDNCICLHRYHDCGGCGAGVYSAISLSADFPVWKYTLEYN